MLRTLFPIIFAALALLALLPLRLHAAPTARDCLTNSTGIWNSPTTWSSCDGGVPTPADNAFVQAGHILTLTADAAVSDLHLSLGPTTSSTDDARLFLDSYVLDLHGKLRGYNAAVGAIPGTSSALATINAITATRGTGGRVRVVGGTRVLAATGEWRGTTTAGSIQPLAVEVALSPGAIVTTEVTFRASNWTITSGTLFADESLYVGENAAGTGSFIVGPEGTLIGGLTGATPYLVTLSSVQAGGSFVVNGKLVLKSAVPRLNMQTVAFNNIVEYAAAGDQTLMYLYRGLSGNISSYQHLVLSGSGVKTLFEPTTVTGSLTLAGTASLATSTKNTLTYAPAAQIIYSGAAAQVTGSELTAVAESIGGLVVANPMGLQLNRSLSVVETLSLAGPLDLGTNTLTLAPGALCSGRGDVLGTVLRTSIPAPGAYCFGNPNVKITLSPTAALPSLISVTRTRGAAPFPGALLLRYQIAAPGFAGAADLRLAYDTDDLNGNDPARLHLWRGDGARWELQAATDRGVDAVGKPYVARSGVTAFSDWALSDGGSPTAVIVDALAVSVQEGHALLTWRTANELECQGFVVRRSRTSGNRGEPLAEIPAQLTGGPGGAAYVWRDPQPLNSFGAPAYYQLDVIDTAGNWLPTEAEVALRLPSLYLPLVAP